MSSCILYSLICQVGGSKDRLAAAMEQAETVEAAAQLEAEHQQQQLAATATDMEVEEGPASPPQDMSPAKSGATWLPQRAALLKSMLNFLKKAIQVRTTTFLRLVPSVLGYDCMELSGEVYQYAVIPRE